LPIVRAHDGNWRLEVLPLIELHNVRGDAFPNHLWRGRLALGATTRAAPSVAITLLVEHESDHRTASGSTPTSGWLVLNGLDGSLGVSGTLEAIADGAGPGAAAGLSPFAVLLLEALAPTDRIVGEARAVLHAGATAASPDMGRWQLYAIAWLGNDVGFRRERRVTHLGAGLRWSMR
jgi:hypothetical protein